jgi:hypothetical protein
VTKKATDIAGGSGKVDEGLQDVGKKVKFRVSSRFLNLAWGWNNGIVERWNSGKESLLHESPNFLRIPNAGNVDPARCNVGCFTVNFDPGAPNNYGPYDFDSMMHYGECAFALAPCPCAVPANCQTIEVLMSCDTTTNRCTNEALKGRTCNNDADCDPRLVGECNTFEDICEKGRVGQPCLNNGDCDIVLRQRDHLSKFDALVMSFLYPEPNWRFVDKSFTGTELGTFLQPFKTFNEGVNDAPSGGTLVIQPGNYNGVGTYTKKMTWMGPVGEVILGN